MKKMKSDKDTYLSINPEKQKEIDKWVYKNLYREEKLSEIDRVKLNILCMLSTGFSTKELRRLIDSIAEKLPDNLSKKEAEAELNKIFERQVIIKKIKKGDEEDE